MENMTLTCKGKFQSIKVTCYSLIVASSFAFLDYKNVFTLFINDASVVKNAWLFIGVVISATVFINWLNAWKTVIKNNLYKIAAFVLICAIEYFVLVFILDMVNCYKLIILGIISILSAIILLLINENTVQNANGNTLDIDDDWIKKNHNRINIPHGFVYTRAVVAFIVLFAIISFMFADIFNAKQITFLGIFGASVVSLIVISFTSEKERRDDYTKAVRSAEIISESLLSINKQISAINHIIDCSNNNIYQIRYPDNWLDYYSNCAPYLKYYYLDYLFREYGYASKINEAIKDRDIGEIKMIIDDRHNHFLNSFTDMDYIRIRTNLSLFSSGSEELKPWQESEEYKKLKAVFLEKYSSIVIEYSIEYLVNNNITTCDVDECSLYVMDKLRENNTVKLDEYDHLLLENRVILALVFNVYLLKLNNQRSKISLCYGMISINPGENS